jgi:hypothetical protein
MAVLLMESYFKEERDSDERVDPPWRRLDDKEAL